MLQKTEMSEVSTNAEARTTSFFTSRNRQMFKQQKKNDSTVVGDTSKQLSKTQLPNDLLILEPELINALSWPEMHFLQNDLSVSIKGNYYQLSGNRGNPKFIQRNAQLGGELVYFLAEQPTRKIHLISAERYVKTSKNDKQRLWLHLNISKYDPENSIAQSSDFYFLSEGKNKQILDFCSLQTIENCKKAVLVMRICNQSSKNKNQSNYRIFLADLVNKTSKSKSFCKEQAELRVISSVDLECETDFGRQNQHLLKTIKSQFGDIVLLITNKEIYQLQIEELADGYKIMLKGYKVSKLIAGSQNNHRSQKNIAEERGLNNKQEQLLDVQFLSGGLKMMLLTSHHKLIILQSHSFLLGQQISQVLNGAQLAQKYDLAAIVCTKIYSINGIVAVQFHGQHDTNILKTVNKNGNQKDEGSNKEYLTKGFLLLKVQNNSLSFLKLINIGIQRKDIQHLIIHGCYGADQILIQYVQKSNPYLFTVAKCRILMGELNAISKIEEIQYIYPKQVSARAEGDKIIALKHYQPQQIQKKYYLSQMPKSSRVAFLLNEKELICYKVFNQLDCQKISKPLTKLFTHTFFEKPLKLTVSPLTLHFAIVFKEFVKFFHFNYSSVKNYFTLKLKNVNNITYIGQGEQLLLTCSDGQLHLLDSYSFKNQLLLQFYGQPIQSQMIDEKHLFVRSNKNTLYFYKRGWDDEPNSKQFVKQYEVRLDQNDHYYATIKQLVIVRKNATIEIYSHELKSIASDLPQAQRQCLINLQNNHKHLINICKCQTFKQDEVPSRILLSQELGFLFIATSFGNIKQYMWPLQPPTNPNPPEVLTQQIASQRILSFHLDARYSSLYVIAEDGSLIELNIIQYINGDKMPYVYLFSQKTKNQEMQKRQFTDRDYLLDHCTPTQLSLVQATQQHIQELQFFVDKLKDDLEEMTKGLMLKGKDQQAHLKVNTKNCQKKFRHDLQAEEGRFRDQLIQLRKDIDNNEAQFINLRNKKVQAYQKILLDLYRESDRLKNILNSQDKKLSEQRDAFKQQFAAELETVNKQKSEQLKLLEIQYKSIEEKKNLTIKQNLIQQAEQDIQMKLFKVRIHEQEQQELEKAEQSKQGLLGQNTKKQKQINTLKNRGNYFQNLILETRVQIGELLKDQEQYEVKKEYLRGQLHEKEDVIQKIQGELVQYLKNTEDMKTIKNNHQFELEEYQKEVAPIHDNFKQVEDNVKHMNAEIMKQYNLKQEKVQLINEQIELLASLKETKKDKTINKLEIKGKFDRFIQKITFLAIHTFDCDLKNELKTLLNQGERAQQNVRMDEMKERQKRQAEKLMRYKNMLRKQIQEEEKRQNHIIKNQHQFYKYHVENTTLVRQFNELKKAQKYLSDEQNKMAEKLALIKATRHQTPLKRIPSISLKKIDKKLLTPFQRYEEEQSILGKKQQDTSQTKLSRNSQSLSFLKGLLKEVGQVDSKYQKTEVMRERVRTFVNPELKNRRNDQIQKILFGRSRGTSQMLKLK